MPLKRKRDTEQMLQSRQIKFVIGPEKIEYSVYESSLVALSEKLKSNFAGLANDAFIYWEDVEPDTFVNLIEYAYWKDYTVPALTEISKTAPAADNHQEKDDNVKVESDNDGDSDESDNDDDSDESDNDDDSDESDNDDDSDESDESDANDEDEPVNSLRDHLEAPRHRGAQHKYICKHFTDTSEKKTSSRTKINAPIFSEEPWIENIKQQGHTGYLPVLMTHIRLCLLAQKHCMGELSDLCIHRLRQSFLHCPGTGELFLALVSIIKTVYQETRPNNELRTLVVQTCVTDMLWMMENDEFHDLIRQTPEFSADLLIEIPLAYWEEVGCGVKKKQH